MHDAFHKTRVKYLKIFGDTHPKTTLFDDFTLLISSHDHHPHYRILCI